jgi:uncharacterized phage protein (TIGR02218 family)
MSKTVPSALLTHYALGTTTMAHAIRITRTDGTVYGFTEHDISDTISGVTYVADDPGFSVDQIAIAAGCDVGNFELRALDFGTVFTSADIAGGLWRNAAWLLFRYNFRQGPPITDIDEILAGTFGEVEIRDGVLVVECHDLRRYLNQPVGSARSKTCRYRLGSSTMATGGPCMVDLDESGANYTVPFEVTHVTGTARLVFRDSSLNGVLAADWFGEGSVTFETGNLAGISAKVYSYAADGTFTLSVPTMMAIVVGDSRMPRAIRGGLRHQVRERTQLRRRTA